MGYFDLTECFLARTAHREDPERRKKINNGDIPVAATGRPQKVLPQQTSRNLVCQSLEIVTGNFFPSVFCISPYQFSLPFRIDLDKNSEDVTLPLVYSCSAK